MTTTKSPAETFSQQAEAVASKGKEGTWKDTAARLAEAAPYAAVDFAFAALWYAESYRQRQNARNARQRVNRINRNPSSRSGRGDL